MSVMDLEGFPTVLDARYTQIKFEEFAGIDDVIPKIYTRRDTDRLNQYATSVGEFKEWELFTGQLNAQSLTEQYQVTSRPRPFGMMTSTSRRLARYELSELMNGKNFRPLVRSGMLTKQRHATEPFSMLTVNDTRWFVRSEGVPIVSASHTTRTQGVATTTGFSNYTADPLTPLSLLAAKVAGRKMKNSEGYRMDLLYDAIILPVDMVDTYNEIANTRMGFDIPGQNENQASRERTGIRKVIVLPQWTSTTGWLLVNERMMKENCTWFTGDDEDYGSITNFSTLQIQMRGYMDHGPQIDNWRWCYGGGM